MIQNDWTAMALRELESENAENPAFPAPSEITYSAGSFFHN
jgi:hypothetical protein